MHTSRATARRWVFGLAALALLLPRPALANADEIQALFVTKVAVYVEWPVDTFTSPDAPIVIGVLDDEPFSATLESVAVDARAKARSFEVRPLASLEEAKDCHILVLGSNRRSDLRAVARALRGKSVLTIAASQSFAEDGGMLSMWMYRGRVAFEVNNKTAKQGDLKISSPLLSLASNVY